MKISICGKGGSGKSTLVALLANEFRRRGQKVLVVDSDESNAGLHFMLGMDEPPTPLMELAGGRKEVRQTLKETGEEASVLARDRILVEDLPADQLRTEGDVSLAAVGKIHQALEGCACPIGVLSREFLKRLDPGPDRIVLVDMEAGVEHFGRGVETSVDAVIAVVEPTMESVSLAKRIQELADATGARFAGVVLNKVGSDNIRSRIEEKLEGAGLPVIGVVGQNPEITEAALEGEPLPPGTAAEEIRAVADAVAAQAGTPAGEDAPA